jgi:hypothetical protein
MRLLVENSTSTTLFTQWLDYLIPLYSGRVRSFADYLTRERANATSVSALRIANPVVAARVNDASTAGSALVRLKKRVDKELGP